MNPTVLLSLCFIRIGQSFVLRFPNTFFGFKAYDGPLSTTTNVLHDNTDSPPCAGRTSKGDGYGLSATAKSTTTKKKSKQSSLNSPAISLKGFGGYAGVGGGSRGRTSSPDSVQVYPPYELDRSQEALAFYDYVEKSCIGIPNFKRVALAYFPMDSTGDKEEPTKMRGVVALRPIKKGEVIIQIPYSMAINLGTDGTDVTSAAVNLLHRMFLDSTNPVFKMLPGINSTDCWGSTDFFSTKALDELQFPPIKEETLARREKVRRRCQSEQKSQPKLVYNDEATYELNIEKAVPTEDHLRWAVWLVASRTLTVQGSSDGLSTPTSNKLLIPLIDMCNHDRNSLHILTGRAAPGGMLKVIAGCNIDAGEEIRFCYGGGIEGNDRFIQDYGFLDDNAEAYNIIAQNMIGRKKYSATEINHIYERLSETSMDQDEDILKEQKLTIDMRTAIRFRFGLKKAVASLKSLN